jgi:dihydroflavonol-4-reductase
VERPRAVVTGASGLLGANLAVALHEAGYALRCTRRAGSQTAHLRHLPDLEWVEADLADEAALTQAFGGARFVFHCAAAVDLPPWPTPALRAANVEGVAHVLAACRAAGVGRLVHCSTAAAVGVSEAGELVTEETPYNFEPYGLADGYSLTKRDGERLAMAAAAAGQDVVVVNPTYMLGPYDLRPSSGAILVALAKGRLPLAPPGANNFVDVRDVARGMIGAAERGARGERYILGGVDLPWATMLGMAAAGLGRRPPFGVAPEVVLQMGGWVGDLFFLATGRPQELSSTAARWACTRRYTLSSEKARGALGYTVRPLEETLQDALADLRARGLIDR